MGVIPWGFESPLRHQVGRPRNGVRNERADGGTATRFVDAPRFWAARRCAPKIETSWRAKRATASSDSWFLFVKGGRAPFSHFPPSHAGSEQVRCRCFCALGQAPLALMARRRGNADLQVGTAARSAADGSSLIPTEGAARQGAPTSCCENANLREPRPPGWRATAERRSPTGIARERETSADDAAPRSGESRVSFTARRPGNADLQVGTAARSAADGSTLIPTEGAAGKGTPASSPRVPPFHAFPPVRQGANKFAAVVFCALGQAPLSFTARRLGNADLQVGTAARSAAGGSSLIPTEGAARQGAPTSCCANANLREPRPPGWRATAEPPPGELGRSPTGIARERETSADDAAPRSGESRVFFMTGEGAQEDPTSRTVPPVGAGAPTHLQQLRQEGPGRDDQRPPWVGERIPVDVLHTELHLEGERRADLILKVFE